MPLGKYLLSIGLLQPKNEPKPEKKKNYTICRIKPTGSEMPVYLISDWKSIHEGDYVEFPMGFSNCSVFGRVDEVISCNEDSAPCDIAQTKTISRKVGVREYNIGTLRSTLNVNASITTEEMIRSASINDFNPTYTARTENTVYIPWACVRGMSTEIMKILDYLVQKDDQIYSYFDIILTDSGVSELYVYTDDAKDVLERYPDVKMAMFAENKESDTVALYYSRSGFSVITDSCVIGECDMKNETRWTLKHSPVDDFEDDGVNYTFMFHDDWDAVNYVFTDGHGSRKQLGK